jgi:glycyl-tRNA synthetase beta chain
MGRYYAQHDGFSDDIAFAIEDHYKPRFAGDELPRSQVGLCVALADKLETLVGLFGIGEKPTGDKDPFALRRHALGVIRMLTENNLPLTLGYLILLAKESLVESLVRQMKVGGLSALMADESLKKVESGDVVEDVSNFIFDRLAGSLREQGYNSQEVDAVLALRPQKLGDIPKRLEAVRSFSALSEAENLAAANKRIGNILKKAEGTVEARVDAALLKEPAEAALHQALANVKPQADAAFERGDYTSSLQALAALKTPVDAFFDNVMVNADDPALRANRLGLLALLHQAMNRVADLSRLAS